MTTTSISGNSSATTKLHYAKEKKEQSSKLKKTDYIDDLFNNRNDVDEKNSRKQPARLYLSKASQLLRSNLKERITDFLASNRDIEKALQQIALPEEELSSKQLRSNIRRLDLYANWLHIHENHTIDLPANVLEEETAYYVVHQLGKNEQIKAIYQQQQKDVDFVKQKQKQALPNYYYLTYPETYAFN